MPLRRQDGHREDRKVLEAATALAVGAAAGAFVAGIGTYLYIRFTQDRRKPPTVGARQSRAGIRSGL